MVKQTELYPYHGIPLRNKKEQSTKNIQQHGQISKALYNMKEVKLKRLHTYSSIYVTFWKREYDRRDNQKEIVRARVGGWVDYKLGIRKFEGVVEPYVAYDDGYVIVYICWLSQYCTKRKVHFTVLLN